MLRTLLSSPRPNATGRQALLAALTVLSFILLAPAWTQAAEPEKAAGAHADTAPEATQRFLRDRVRTERNVRIIAMLRAGADQRPAIAGAQARIATRLWNRGHSMPGWRAYRAIPAIAMEVDATSLADLEADPDVVAVQEDRLARPDLSVSGPLITAPTSWSFGYGGQGSAVAILDTGVDRGHPFFAGRVVAEACFSTTYAAQNATTLCPNGQDVQIGLGAGAACTGDSSCFHGTHVAGIAAGYQSASFAGVAKDAQIISIQVFSRFSGQTYCGSSSTCIASYTSDQLQALDYLLGLNGNYRIGAVNMSLGGAVYTSQVQCDANNAVLKQAIDALRAVRVATVIAAGNNGYVNAVSEPGCISSAIAVGNSTAADTLYMPSNIAAFVQLMAPGSSIRSAVPGGGYGYATGTSMATPQVAGALAVLRQANPNASVSEMVGALRQGGKALTITVNGSSGTKYTYSIPRLDVGGGVSALCASCIMPVTGWWWNPAEPGRGYSLEARDGRMYLGAYLYDTDGTPMWLAGTAAKSGTASLAGLLAKYGSGQTLSSAYQVPQLLGAVGSATLTFSSPTTGTLTWPGGTTPIQRFPVNGQTIADSPAGAPPTGWWWNPAESGTGWFIEVQGANLFVSGYMYDVTGRPVWYVSSGPMLTPAAFDGDLQVYAGGQTLAGSYQAPSTTAAIGRMSLRFDGAGTATVTLPTGRLVTLTRFTDF